MVDATDIPEIPNFKKHTSTHFDEYKDALAARLAYQLAKPDKVTNGKEMKLRIRRRKQGFDFVTYIRPEGPWSKE